LARDSVPGECGRFGLLSSCFGPKVRFDDKMHIGRGSVCEAQYRADAAAAPWPAGNLMKVPFPREA
jgi:hypothetical protein